VSVLTARGLAKSYGPHDIFEGIACEIPHGAKIALVGPNGSGKTTLLRLLAGLEPPSAGSVERAKSLRVGYLPQQADFPTSGTLWEAMLAVFAGLRAQAEALRRLEEQLAADSSPERLAAYGRALEAFEMAGGYSYETRVRQVLAGLGFTESDAQTPLAHLSGGQKTRALLAKLLLEEPGLLLLDEPTNHLDLEGIEWLEATLKAWPGALVVVAHDRAFLDAVVDEVWELAWGRLTPYRGNYSAYVQQRAAREARQEALYERQQEQIARTEEFIRRNMEDNPGQAKSRQRLLARLERIERPRHYQPLHLHLGHATRTGDLVVGLYDLSVGYDAALPLIRAREVELRRGERVALVGPNGCGKTTLLRTILGETPPLAGRVRIGAGVRIGHFVQGHANLVPERSVLDTILAAHDLRISEARDFLALYRFRGDEIFKRVGDLSGGEQARVALALLALQRANVLFLDEPTNHLDIPSQEVLQEVLADFGGTLLMVTHDRYLIGAMHARVWAVAAGELHVFPEGYPQYRAWLTERPQKREETCGEKARALDERERAREAQRRIERAAARRMRRQAELEQAIHQLEQRLAELETQLARASAEQAVERVRQLGAEYGDVQAALDAHLAEWAELAA